MRPEDLYDAFHEIDDDLLKPLPRGCAAPASGAPLGRACGLRPAGRRRTALAAAVEKCRAAVISCRSHAGE